MKDHLLIATAYNDEARIYVSYTKTLVEKARKIHKTWPTATAALGRLLTAASMMSFFNKDESSLTLRIDGDGPIGWLLAESNAQGEVRGNVDKPDVYLKYNDSNKLAVGLAIGNGHLTIIRNPHLKNAYSSTVELITSEIAEDLTYYFSSSEQVPSSVGLGVLVNEDTSIKHAGGFIIQLLPQATEETIIQIEGALQKLTSVTNFFDNNKSTNELLTLLANGTENILEKHELKYHCECTKKYFSNLLQKLDITALETIIKEDKKAEIICQYCKKVYNFTEKELTEIVTKKQPWVVVF